LFFQIRLGDEQMAAIFQARARPQWQAQRRVALVTFLLSPTPPTLLKIAVAICGIWAVVVVWAAISLIKILMS
jgi:hypothetical protein